MTSKSCSLQPWYWRSQPLHHRTGSEVYAALFHNQSSFSISTLLESPGDKTAHTLLQSRYSICAGAPRITQHSPQMWTPAVGEILPLLSQLLQRAGDPAPFTKHPTGLEHLPFTGGWLGWLGYDLAWEIEQLPRLNLDPLPFPVAYWYEPECFAVLDHWQQVLWLAASNPQQLDQLQQRLEQPQRAADVAVNGENFASVPKFWTTQTEYEAMVAQAKRYIQAGDIFQTNLSLRFELQTQADSWSIYRALQQINPSPFASYWQTPWGALISCSPERLVKLQGQEAETRPIAGTRSRGATPSQDQQQAQDLTQNAKENAEHIMLVDLERNDLGRVCDWGSVVVDELLTIERYSHVMHLVSNVKGSLRTDCNAVDLIRALFPGGTITGCPKVRCMEIIEELEPARRSLFYGSCGYLDQRGHLDLNILIRTLLTTHSATSPSEQGASEQGASNQGAIAGLSTLSKVWGQVGAGIVADSDPEKEWHESLQKAKAQLAALNCVAGGDNP